MPLVEHIVKNNVVVCVKAQEDVTGVQKRDGEVEEEDTYNEENLEQVSSHVGKTGNLTFSINKRFILIPDLFFKKKKKKKMPDTG